MRKQETHPGFTLIETIAVVLVVGVLAGVTAPLMVGAADAYAGARDGRRATENAAFALDRIVRILREAPAGATPGEPEFTKALPHAFALGNGTQVILSGQTLMLSVEGSALQPLCAGVTAFELSYLGDDGAELDFAGGDLPGSTRRMSIRLVADGQELRTTAFLRVALGGAS